MIIKIIGKKSSNEMKLEKNLRKAIENTELDQNPDINIEDSNKNYNIKNTPALIINSDIVSEGKVLTEREISHLLKSYAN